MLVDAGFERCAALSFGFGPFTLLGRRLFSDHTDVRLHRRLQRLPALWRWGTEYLLLARRLH